MLYCWDRNRYREYLNRLESPEINLYICEQLLFDKGLKSIKWEKNSLQQMVLVHWIFTCRKNEVEPYLIPHLYTKINSKYFKKLNTRAKTIKLLEENIRVNFHYHRSGNGLLNMTPKVQETTEKIKIDKLMKIKNTHQRAFPESKKQTIAWKKLQIIHLRS